MAIVHEQTSDPSAWKPRSTLLGSLLVHRYRLTQLIGQGSTGAVYRADDVHLNRPVAVRILAPSLSQNMGLISRIRARIDEHAKVEQQHPGALINLVDAFDVGITLEGEVFVVTDFLDGDHLSTMLTRGGRLPWSRARNLLVRLCQLIHGFHGHGLVLGTLQGRHCYAVRNRPKHEAIKILNTALIEHAAYNLGPAAGEAGVAVARYASPERLCGEPLDARADVYSFGVIAYELLTGRVPFVGTNAIRLAALHLQTPPLPLRQVAPDAGIPAAVEELVLKALAKAPADRLATMEAFANALLAVPEHEAAPAAAPYPGIAPIATAPVPPVSLPVAPPKVAAAPLTPPVIPKLAPSIVMRGVVEQPAPAPAPAPVPAPALSPPRRPSSIPMPAAVLPSLRPLSGPVPAADKPREKSVSVAAALTIAPTVEPPKKEEKPDAAVAATAAAATVVAAAAADKPQAEAATTPADKPLEPAAPTADKPAEAAPTDKPAAPTDKPAEATDKPATPAPADSPTPTPSADKLALAPVVPIAADKPAPADDKPVAAAATAAAATAAATIITPVLADRLAARVAPADKPQDKPEAAKAAPADRSPETAKPAARDVGFVVPPLVAAAAPERPQPAPARLSVAPGPQGQDERRPAAPEVAPDELRAAALRQSTERHPSLSQITDSSDSIIAELPRRRIPWVAVVGFGAAIAAGAAAYIQTQPADVPPGSRPAVQQPTPTPSTEPAKLPPGTVAVAEGAPEPTGRDAALDKLAEDPVPGEPPPTAVPDEPTPTAKTEPAAEKPSGKPSAKSSEPKEPKKKKSRSKAVPEEEEEDVFDQLRKHMEAKKAAEDARAAALASSQPPAPTPAPKIDGDSAAKARDTLDRARQAASQGNHTLAYSLAKQSYGIAKTTDALELMGMSACKAGNADNARAAANQLAGSRRSAIVDACAKNGITL